MQNLWSTLSKPFSRDQDHRTLKAHTGHVWCLAITDQTVFSGSADGSICAWDVRPPHRLRATMTGHVGIVYCLVVMENKLISGGADRTVRLWDIRTFACDAVSPSGPPTAPAADGSTNESATVLSLVYVSGHLLGGGHDGSILQWTLSNGALHACPPRTDAHSAAVYALTSLQPAGASPAYRPVETAASGSADGRIKLWSFEKSDGGDGGVIHLSRSIPDRFDPSTTPDGIYALACVPGGGPNGSALLYSGHQSHAVVEWSVADGAVLRTLAAHSSFVTAIHVAGHMLLTGSSDNTWKLWDRGTLNAKATHTGHKGGVYALNTFEGTVFTASSDATVRAWPLPGAPPPSRVAQPGPSPRPAPAAPSEASFGAALQPGYEAVLPGGIGCGRLVSAHTDCVWALAVDGDRLYSASSDGDVKVWSLPDCNKLIGTLSGHRSTVYCLHFAGGCLYSGSSDCSVREWSTETLECSRELHVHKRKVLAIASHANAVSPALLISGCGDGSVATWSPLDGGVTRATLTAHEKEVYVLKVWNDTLITAGGDGAVRLWELPSLAATAQQLPRASGHSGAVYAATVCADDTLATASQDCRVLIWHLPTRSLVHSLEAHQSFVTALSTPMCSASGSELLASGSSDSSVLLWDVARGACVASLSGHGVGVYALTAHDGLLLSAARNGSVRVWTLDGTVTSVRAPTPPPGPQQPAAPAFSPTAPVATSKAVGAAGRGLSSAELQSMLEYEAASVHWVTQIAPMWRSLLLSDEAGRTCFPESSKAAERGGEAKPLSWREVLRRSRAVPIVARQLMCSGPPPSAAAVETMLTTLAPVMATSTELCAKVYNSEVPAAIAALVTCTSVQLPRTVACIDEATAVAAGALADVVVAFRLKRPMAETLSDARRRAERADSTAIDRGASQSSAESGPRVHREALSSAATEHTALLRLLVGSGAAPDAGSDEEATPKGSALGATVERLDEQLQIIRTAQADANSAVGAALSNAKLSAAKRNEELAAMAEEEVAALRGLSASLDVEVSRDAMGAALEAFDKKLAAGREERSALQSSRRYALLLSLDEAHASEEQRPGLALCATALDAAHEAAKRAEHALRALSEHENREIAEEISAQCGAASRALDGYLDAQLDHMRILNRRLSHLEQSRASLEAISAVQVDGLRGPSTGVLEQVAEQLAESSRSLELAHAEAVAVIDKLANATLTLARVRVRGSASGGGALEPVGAFLSRQRERVAPFAPAKNKSS